MSMVNGRRIWVVLIAVLGGLAVLAAANSALTGQGPAAPKTMWLIFSLGSAAILWAACVRAGNAAFGLAALALMAGGAGVLHLTAPLYFPVIRDDFSDPMNRVAAGLVVVQLALSGLLLRGQVRVGWSVLARMGLLRLGSLGVMVTLMSVSIMHYLPQQFYAGYAKQIVAHALIIAIQAMNIAALLSLPAPHFLRRPQSPWRASLVAAAASALLAWLAVEFVPHVEDELAYLFQARIFLGGHLVAPPPPAGLVPGLTYYLLTITEQGWSAVTTPGWPAILTVGVALGQPWLLNPVLAGISVLLAYRLCCRMCDRDTAGLVATLLAVSPWFLGSAATLMPHLAALTFMLASWTIAQRAPDRVAALLLAGLMMGVVFTIRQLEALLIGTLTGTFLLAYLWQRGQPLKVGAYGLGCIATGGLLLAYYHVMTGSALTSPLQLYLDELWHVGANRYGFGADIGPRERWGALDFASGHSLVEALVYTGHNLFYVNFELFGWVIGSAVLPLFHLLFGRQSRTDLGAWLIVLIVPLAHLGYWFSGSFYIGPRYWFAMLVPLVYLSARGATTLAARLDVSREQVRAAVMVMCLFSLTVFTTWRGAEKYRGYGDYDGAFRDIARQGEFGRDVVIYKGASNPGVALFLNNPYLPDDLPIFLDGPVESIRPPADRTIIIWAK